MSELYHSDVYLGEDYSNGLVHWKYLKRYRNGNKWVYVYADKKTHSNIQSVQQKARNKELSSKILENTAFESKKSGTNTAHEDWKEYMKKSKDYKNASDKLNEVANKMMEGNRVSDIPKNIITKGINFLKKFSLKPVTTISTSSNMDPVGTKKVTKYKDGAKISEYIYKKK